MLLPLLTDQDGGVDLVYSSNQILASIDADRKTYVGSPRPTGRFPNYQAIIPTDNRTDVCVKVHDLSVSLSGVRCSVTRKSNAIDLTFIGGELTIHAATLSTVKRMK